MKRCLIISEPLLWGIDSPGCFAPVGTPACACAKLLSGNPADSRGNAARERMRVVWVSGSETTYRLIWTNVGRIGTAQEALPHWHWYRWCLDAEWSGDLSYAQQFSTCEELTGKRATSFGALQVTLTHAILGFRELSNSIEVFCNSSWCLVACAYALLPVCWDVRTLIFKLF